MSRMRTIKGAVQCLKSIDPDCAITEHFLRGLVKTNKIRHHKAGCKYLIDLDSLEAWLTNPLLEEQGQGYGKLRKIL